VMANGLGNIDAARFAKALEQIKITYEFKNPVQPAAIFTDAYLPSAELLKMN
jgi:NitT/TauT family transport system substrate-binding protein